MIRKRLRDVGISLALVASLILTSAVGVSASTVKTGSDTIDLDKTAKEVTFDIVLDADNDYAGAEFGVKPSSDELNSPTVNFAEGYNESNVSIEKDGVFYFGYFAGDNSFKAGESTVAQVTYTYEGNEEENITLDYSNIVTVKDGKTASDKSSEGFAVTVKRAAVNEEPTTKPTTPTKPTVKTKKAQALKATAKTKNLKVKKLKKKAVTYKPITVKNAKGKVTYKVVSGNKKSKKALKLNKKTGKITVKKKTKKGTYSIKVKVTAAGNSTYKAASKTVTVKVKVKK